MQPIINSDLEFKKFVGVNVGFSFDNLKDDIQTALAKEVIPYLGIAQYDVSIKSTNEKHKELIRLAAKISANIGMANYLPIAKVQISNGGISYTADKSKQATAEDKEDLRLAFLNKGYNTIDEMLLYLETNADDFQEWKSSTGKILFNKLFIRTADEFRIIQGKRSIFIKLIPYMEDIELEVISHLFPSTLITDLKTKVVTGKKKELLENYIRPIVANKALARALTAFAIVLTDSGLSVFDNTSANQTKGYKEANQQRVDALRDDLERTATNRIVMMNAFKKDFASDLGLTITTNTKQPFRNPEETKTKFF